MPWAELQQARHKASCKPTPIQQSACLIDLRMCRLVVLRLVLEEVGPRLPIRDGLVLLRMGRHGSRRRKFRWSNQWHAG